MSDFRPFCPPPTPTIKQTCTMYTCQHVCMCTCAPTIGKDAPWDVLLEEASIKKIARRITQSVTTVGSRTRPPHFLINSRNFCMLELSLRVRAKISWFLSRAKPYVGSHVQKMGHLLVQLTQVPGYAHSENKPVTIHTCFCTSVHFYSCLAGCYLQFANHIMVLLSPRPFFCKKTTNKHG